MKGNKFMKKINSFTLAEILISLTIIGIIAALTLPALMSNLNEKVWNTKRKALHSRMAQALAAMPNLDRYLDSDDNSADYNFINNGLATTLNITKVCDEDNMSKCDFAYPERDMNDDVIDSSGWDDIVSYNTINGESLGVYYNPDCRGESTADFRSETIGTSDLICANFIYDLNGASKGPNKMGKDMGIITAYFPEYPLVVAPMSAAISGSTVTEEEIDDLLSSDYRLPSPAEAVALSFNFNLISTGGGTDAGVDLWTDNGVICNDSSCTKPDSGAKAGSASAYLVLVSKNGDAP